MRKSIYRLLLDENKWNFAALAISCLGIGGLLTFLEQNTDFLYLGILIFVLCVTAHLAQWMKNYEFYYSLVKETGSMDDFYVAATSPLAFKCGERMRAQRNMYAKQLEELENKNNQYKIMVNQWIHQMKTPVTVLSMLAEKNRYDENFDKVGAETRRMNELLNQIMNMMRVEHIGTDFVVGKQNVLKLVKAAVNAQKNYFLEKEVYPKVDILKSIEIYTDKKWFVFALEQLINNAVKYSGSGRNVWISARTCEDKVMITVKDEGCGILKEDADKVFELFYTGKNGRAVSKESTGMGLYIVKTVFDYLGHSVSISSVPGEGTIFKIEI